MRNISNSDFEPLLRRTMQNLMPMASNTEPARNKAYQLISEADQEAHNHQEFYSLLQSKGLLDKSCNDKRIRDNLSPQATNGLNVMASLLQLPPDHVDFSKDGEIQAFRVALAELHNLVKNHQTASSSQSASTAPQPAAPSSTSKVSPTVNTEAPKMEEAEEVEFVTLLCDAMGIVTASQSNTKANLDKIKAMKVRLEDFRRRVSSDGERSMKVQPAQDVLQLYESSIPDNKSIIEGLLTTVKMLLKDLITNEVARLIEVGKGADSTMQSKLTKAFQRVKILCGPLTISIDVGKGWEIRMNDDLKNDMEALLEDFDGMMNDPLSFFEDTMYLGMEICK